MTGNPEPPSVTPEQRRAIQSLFDNLPGQFEERARIMQAIRSAFYDELARQLAPSLNAFAKAQPHGSEGERRHLASWINQTVRHFGLSLECPITGKPAILVVDNVMVSHRPVPRFRFETRRGSLGGRQKRGTSDEVPDLELMQAPLRVENLSREFKGPGR